MTNSIQSFDHDPHSYTQYEKTYTEATASELLELLEMLKILLSVFKYSTTHYCVIRCKKCPQKVFTPKQYHVIIIYNNFTFTFEEGTITQISF